MTAPGMVLLAREHRSSSSSSHSPSPESEGSGGAGESGGAREWDGARESAGSQEPSGPRESTGSQGSGGSKGADGAASPDPDNPFAPPPADTPDQEWRPRHPAPHGQGQQGDQDQPPQDEPAPTWGSQWSSRQPRRQSGGFGTRPNGRGQQGGGQNGPGGPGGPGGLRWDPTDPAQRRARYALLGGMWSFFFVLFSLPEIALLLGALAIYWSISSLRAKPNSAKTTAEATTAAMEGRPAPGQNPDGPSAPYSTRPQTTAAIAGLVTATLALMMVAATFTLQIVYRDYFTCVDDALTQQASKSCENLLPKQLRPLLGTQD
ncbi:hypothetical protein K9S39_18105 [Streptomyces halobius]|uniref:Integral membrane protein n=1 Tax=Streptomyces halobius TaxID=2879846 RepID=A0ABY4M9P9_9ACTN|nr:hypothetical protein [Streptomyces halobius]UQA93509.1 hypothetical protein K9S39_18105 [Streptomyces halobius]